MEEDADERRGRIIFKVLFLIQKVFSLLQKEYIYKHTETYTLVFPNPIHK